MVASLAGLSYFIPIVSWLFVFVLVYAILAKTKVLGENNAVSLIISFIIAVFFVVNLDLVDSVNVATSWIVVFFICVFLILLLLGFVGKESLEIVTKSKAIAWVLVVGIVLIFVLSFSKVFSWALTWDSISNWFDEDWFGMILLLIVGFVAIAYVVPKVKK